MTSSSGGVKFGSKAGFILATAGSAVGLGNIWRFPFVVGENGGGVFLLPYLISVTAIGIPIMVVEMAAGRGSGKGIVGTFAAFSKRAKWLGLLVALGSLVLLSYYLVVTGWSLGYLAFGLAGRHPGFDDFTEGANSILFFLASAGITTLIVSLGVRGGIEALSKILMPGLLLLVVGLAIYGLTLPGRDEALKFYLTPDPSALANPTVWIRALGQAFFSLGVGMGVLTTYGAYISRGTNLVKSSAVVVAIDIVIAFLAGFVIFPIAFTFGSEPGSGPQLAFDTLPRAFESLGPAVGYIVAVLFYLALLVAALTSAVSLLETVAVGLRDVRGISRRVSLGIVLALLLMLGMPSALSYSGLGLEVAGRRVFDVVDTAVGTFGLPIGVFITGVTLSWLGSSIVSRGLESRARISLLVVWVVRWMVPFLIPILFAAMLFDSLRHRIIPLAG